jgi:hypothetical protein
MGTSPRFGAHGRRAYTFREHVSRAPPARGTARSASSGASRVHVMPACVTRTGRPRGAAVKRRPR